LGRKVFFKTFGCRSNQYDTEFLRSQLESIGLLTVENPDEADLVVINSCAVTHKAERESRREVRRHLRKGKRVIYTGCAAKLNPYHKAHLSGSIEEVLSHFGITDPSPLRGFTRARGILKVQEGCDFACSYCVIRFARGGSRSISLSRILKEAEKLSFHTREITLTGTQIGDWGKEWGMDLPDLLHILTSRFPHVRFRISSIGPLHITERLIDVMVAKGNICPHLHISVQSGSDRILRLMKRPYTRAFYESRLDLAYSRIPDLAVGTDVIVGFPGETEEDFNQTLELLKNYPFAYIHAFEYSPRPGTPAYSMGEVPASVRKVRMRRIQDLIRRKKKEYRRRFLGRILHLYVERKEGDLLLGTTENYLKVAVESSEDLVGSIVPVEIFEDRDTGIMIGKVDEAKGARV